MVNNINIEVVCIQRAAQTILPMQVPVDSTIRFAIEKSNLITDGIENLAVGIFGRIRHLDFVIQEGDRIEIYRPLINDPKVARTTRVQMERRAKRINRQKKFSTQED